MKQLHTYDTHILAFGPHPDDVEVGAGGILAKTAAQGKKNVIIDLCLSEMSTHGDTTTRMKESQLAATVLGVHHRDNLLLCDSMLEDSVESRTLVAREIRKWKPEIVLMPWSTDRHPDHEISAQLIKNGVFYAGLKKLDIDGLPVHKPRLLVYYKIWSSFESDFIIPMSEEELGKKFEAFTTYGSQEKTNSRGLDYLKARHVIDGHEIGAQYGEGFKLYSHSVGVNGFDNVMSGFF